MTSRPLHPVAFIEMDLVFAYSSIDRVVTQEIRPPSMPRGVVGLLYNAALADSNEPLGYSITVALTTEPVGRIGIATGALGPTLPAGENDGPFGAVVLANALFSIGYDVAFLAEEPIIPVLQALARLRDIDPEVYPLEIGRGDEHALLADELDGLICIERAGANPAGVLHSMTGTSRDGTRAKIDGLVASMNAAGKLTVGIGDGGNEIGFGNIRESVKDLVPFGAVCKCPCRQGSMTSTRTRHLYPVAVSNWGAYGLAASIAIMTGNLSILQTPRQELEFFDVALTHDCRDGVLGVNQPFVDGVRAETSAAVCQILQNIAELEVQGDTLTEQLDVVARATGATGGRS